MRIALKTNITRPEAMNELCRRVEDRMSTQELDALHVRVNDLDATLGSMKAAAETARRGGPWWPRPSVASMPPPRRA